MGKRILVLGLVGLAVSAIGCKSSPQCPTCTCDGGGAATAAVAAPTGPAAAEPAASGAGPSATPTSPTVVGQPSAAKCVGPRCDEAAEEPGDPGSGPPVNDPSSTPPLRPVPVAPVLSADVAPAGPLAPGLAAHLTRLPGNAELVLVTQVDVRALLSPAEVRTALGGLAELLRREVSGDPACLVELAAAIDMVTVEAVEYSGGRDTAVAILEGSIDLAGMLECAGTLAPDEFPRELIAQVARGYVELDGDFAAASLGARTVVVGDPELVREVRAGRVARPLSTSAEFEAARKAVGAGPAYLVVLARDDGGERNDESFVGGAVLRTTPRLGVAGSFTFAVAELAGEVIAEFTEMATELDREQAEVLGELRRMPGGAAVVGDATKLFEAFRQARLTLQDRSLSFEVWLPEGMTVASLSSSLQRVLPWLLLGADSSDAPPARAAVPEVPAALP